MQYIKTLLNWAPVLRVRRNHALEHATFQVIAEKKSAGNLAGFSDTRGFWVLGDIDSEALVEAIEEARARLVAGEHHLAIHPNCGTNFAVAGIVAGFFGWLSMLRMGKDWKDRLDRLPNVITMVTIGTIIAQPLGPRLQQLITVEPNIANLRPLEVLCYQEKQPPVHRVLTGS